MVNRSHKPGLTSASEWLYNRFPCSIGPEVSCGWQRRQELLRERKLRQEWVDKNGQEWASLNCAIFGLAVLSKKSLMAAQPLASVFGRSSNRAVQADPSSRLQILSFPSGKVKTIVQGETLGLELRTLTVAPGGRSILYSRPGPQHSELMLVENFQ